MEYKVYRTTVEVTHKDVDMDMCSTWKDETVFDNTFSSKTRAIANAQRAFAKYHMNGYVISVFAYVREVFIGDNGMRYGKAIYRKYKSDEQ